MNPVLGHVAPKVSDIGVTTTAQLNFILTVFVLFQKGLLGVLDFFFTSIRKSKKYSRRHLFHHAQELEPKRACLPVADLACTEPVVP